MAATYVSKLIVKFTSPIDVHLNDMNVHAGRVYKDDKNKYTAFIKMKNDRRKRLLNYTTRYLLTESVKDFEIDAWNGEDFPKNIEELDLVFELRREKKVVDTTTRSKAMVKSVGLVEIAQKASDSPDLDMFMLQAVRNGDILCSEMDTIRKLVALASKEREQQNARIYYNDMGLRNWQRVLMDVIDGAADRRIVNWVFDPIGNIGKTTFCSYVQAMYPEQILCVHSCSGKEIMFQLCQMHTPRALLLDVARSKKGEYISFDVCEQVKSGNLFNIKYHPIHKTIPPMHVMIFSNELPPVKKLSYDRWHIYTCETSLINDDVNIKLLSSESVKKLAEEQKEVAECTNVFNSCFNK